MGYQEVYYNDINAEEMIGPDQGFNMACVEELGVSLLVGFEELFGCRSCVCGEERKHVYLLGDS